MDPAGCPEVCVSGRPQRWTFSGSAGGCIIDELLFRSVNEREEGVLVNFVRKIKFLVGNYISAGEGCESDCCQPGFSIVCQRQGYESVHKSININNNT